MKRDLDVMRNLLLEVEALGPGGYMTFRKREEAEQYHNALLLHDAGYLITYEHSDLEILRARGRSVTIEDFPSLSIRRMTNDGHDLLDAIRSETVLTQIRDRIRCAGSPTTLRIIQALGESIIEQQLGLA